ncbi:MAG: ABC transporter ATP-binding protein, partial [Alphaproteobacteria bacterium]|nr:ABC transporter ATP-binding protein [Alphaproteobacteria bacterium]
MHFQFPWTGAQKDAARKSLLAAFFVRHDQTDPAAVLWRRRFGKFVSYYRPHLPLLAAVLSCAVLVAGTALALPLCANYITSHLTGLPAAQDGLGPILAMGGVMLAIFAVQALATY